MPKFVLNFSKTFAYTKVAVNCAKNFHVYDLRILGFNQNLQIQYRKNILSHLEKKTVGNYRSNQKNKKRYFTFCRKNLTILITHYKSNIPSDE